MSPEETFEHQHKMRSSYRISLWTHIPTEAATLPVTDSHAVMPINKSVYCNYKMKAVLLEDLISRRLAFEKRDQWDQNFSGGTI